MKRMVLGAVLMIGVVATISCEAKSPASPGPNVAGTPPIPLPGVSHVVISGTVMLHRTGSVTVTTTALYGWVERDRTGWTTGKVPVAPNGRYSVSIPQGSRLRLYGGSGANGTLMQPCAITIPEINADTVRDVRLIDDDRLLGANLPSDWLAGTRLLSGNVFETTAAGDKRPLSGVEVSLDGLRGNGLVTASTRTGADGRYLLCGLEHDASTYLFAAKAGYKLYEQDVQLAANTTLDIELRR